MFINIIARFNIWWGIGAFFILIILSFIGLLFTNFKDKKFDAWLEKRHKNEEKIRRYQEFLNKKGISLRNHYFDKKGKLP